MPVQSMLSEFSVGNSTLRPVMDAADAEPAESTSKTGRKPGRKKLKSKALDRRAHIALFVLREDVTRALAAHAVSQHPPLARRDGRADDMAAKLEALAELAAEVAAASPHLRSLAAGSRANAVRAYDGLRAARAQPPRAAAL